MTFLDDAILDEFLSALRRLSAPVAETLVSGLSDDEIDAILAPLDIDRHVLSLQENLMGYDDFDGNFEFDGYSKLLQPVDQKPYVIFDCRGARDAPVPVLWSEDIGPPEPWTPSVGSLVLGWIDTLNSGYVTVADDGIWDYGPLTGRAIREIGF